jgi:cation diffusion facilitator family transporter
MDQARPNVERLARKLALWSVLAGGALAVTKLFVGWAAGSAAVVADGFEGLADILSSGIVFIGLWIASRPPDENHPYGHGRYETLSSLAVSAILVTSGVLICWHGFVTMGHAEKVKGYAIYPLLAGIVLKSVLAFMKWRSARAISSSSLAADAWHDLTDLLSTFVALAAVLITLSNPEKFREVDHMGSILIGLIVVSVGLRLTRQTVDQLTDTMPDDKAMRQIRGAAVIVPGALGIEKCFARRTGFKYHVDLHLEVNPELTVRESHEIAAQVKAAIKERLDWVADVLVHVEPAPDANGHYMVGTTARTIIGDRGER